MEQNTLNSQNSLYLLQHANNPVHWQAYSPEIFDKATREKKLILFSIGYSSCHWCHVMEKQCFENPLVAEVMNNGFVCVKIDREERPDLDHIYMQAVQIMTGRGGWPLNCFTLPDGRPVYGGTYFPPEAWIKILNSLNESYKNEPETFLEYAEKLMDGLSVHGFDNTSTNSNKNALLKEAVEKWKKMFDPVHGGLDYAPKFPMPDNYAFLLSYGKLHNDEESIKHSLLTIRKICTGGVFDHLAGGFFRYSTDTEWNVPHFEKMLYDNAQMLSLLAAAVVENKDKAAENALRLTLDFLEKHFLTPYGYLAAIDADSEGQEGFYYTWTEAELDSVCGDENDSCKTLFGITKKNALEDGRYVLSANQSIAENAFTETGLSVKTRKALLERRNRRIHPVIDHKVIASWNALMLSGLCDAFAFHQKKESITNLANLLMQQMHPVNNLFRLNYQGTLTGTAFFDDIAFTCLSLLQTFFITGEKKYALHCESLTEWAMKNYYDPQHGFFIFNPKSEKNLINKYETEDNVTPSSNAVMAEVLLLLGDLSANSEYCEIAYGMCTKMTSSITHYPPGFSRWCRVMLMISSPFYYVIATGTKNIQSSLHKKEHFYPNTVRIHLGEAADEFQMLTGKFRESGNETYICSREYCMPPFTDFYEAMAFLQRDADSRKSSNG